MKNANTVGSLTEKQHAFIVGTMLGDGYMSCKTHAYIKICHSIHQRKYVDWKYSILSTFVQTLPKAYKGNGKRIGYRFCTRSLPILTPYYTLFYGLNKRKHIPRNLQLSPFSLAVWFMDDGAQNRKSVYFNTQQFSREDQEYLLDVLKETFQLEGTLNKDKKYFRIRLFQESAQRLKSIIQQYVPEYMRYKFPL